MPLGANVPYNPTAGVVAAEGIPNDALHVQASPQDFGSQVGQQVEKAGNDAEALGQKYMQMATEAKAENTLANQFAPAAAKLKADFMSKQGIDAVKAEPEYLNSLSNLRGQFLKTAGGPYEEQILSGWMAKHAAQEVDGAATYAANQQNKYEEDSYKAMQGMFASTAAMNYANPGLVKEMMDKSSAHALKFGTDRGKESDYEIPFMQSQSRGDVLKSAIDSATYNGNIPAAKQLFDTYKSEISPKDLKDLDVSLAPKIADYDSRNLVDHYNGHISDQYNWQVYGHGLHDDNNIASKSSIDWTMEHEGGFVANDSGKGPSKFGINQEANPDVDVPNLTQDQAAKIMHDKYWNGVGADKMSPAMGRVAFDTAVNMGVSKTQKLLEQAGDDPQKLIDLRRAEYQRLATANPDKYGKNLAGWNARLDDLQKTLHGGDIASDGKIIPSIADFYEANYSKNLADIRDQAEKMRPGDIKFADSTEARLKQHMDSIIEQTKKVNAADRNTIMRAANGDFSKGEIPMTRDQLINSSPEVKAAADSAQKNNPAFYETIDTIIAKASAKVQTVNSPNGYNTIMRTLEPSDGSAPNAIKNQGQIDNLLGKNNAAGINMKDRKDAMDVLEASQNWKDFLKTNMQSVANANGNIDGQGQTRALNWFNKVSQQYKLASVKDGFDEDDFIENLKESSEPHKVSKMDQISNWAKNLLDGKQEDISAPVLTNKAQFDALPSGATYMRDGVTYRKP